MLSFHYIRCRIFWLASDVFFFSGGITRFIFNKLKIYKNFRSKTHSKSVVQNPLKIKNKLYLMYNWNGCQFINDLKATSSFVDYFWIKCYLAFNEVLELKFEMIESFYFFYFSFFEWSIHLIVAMHITINILHMLCVVCDDGVCEFIMHIVCNCCQSFWMRLPFVLCHPGMF